MGNKSHNLKLLESAGFNVPAFFDVLSSSMKKKELEEIVSEKLTNTALFAVRSSAAVEDGTDKSYAGHFCSKLGVSYNKLYDAYQKVSDSLKGFDGRVIIQRFIPSQKSGVLFTNNGHGLTVVNSNFGLCKAVVEGNACDEWYLSVESKLLRKSIALDKRPIELVNNEITNTNVKSEASLSVNELNELVAECKKIETYFGCPQDIEWCFYDSILYILQARPITRKLPSPNFIYFDSANIAESYSGIVLPLTHSFAVNIYNTVYKNLLVASGVSRKKVVEHNNIFNSLVAGYYGRMFYNMNSWYLMMSFLPGYKRNKQNLEKMLTMNVSEDIIRNVHPSFGLKLGYPFIVFWKLLFFSRTIRKFEHKTRSMLNNSRKTDLGLYSSKMCIDFYMELEKQLLNNFHIPVENDFLLMTFLGMLRKKYPEEQLRVMLSFDSVSSNQVEHITSLSQKLYGLKDFKDAIDTEDLAAFQKHLKLNPEANREIEAYIQCYSGRFANELKLESDDIESDNKLFLKLLKAYSTRKSEIKGKAMVSKGFVLNRFFKYARKREDLRLLRSNSFSLVRRIFIRLGEIYTQQGKLCGEKDIFYCTFDEVILMSANTDADYRDVVKKRKLDYELYKKVNVPSFFALTESEMPHLAEVDATEKSELNGRACNAGTVTGIVRVFHEFEMPEEIDFDIIVAKNTDPGWSLLIGLSKGMIIENGGILSHAAIVSRELGIPTIIGVESATKKLRTGQKVELNGSTGSIRIIQQ